MKRTSVRAMKDKAKELAKMGDEFADMIEPALDNLLDFLPSPVSNGMGPSTSGGDKSTLDSRIIDNRSGNIRRNGDPHAGYVQQLNADMQVVLRAYTRMKATARKMMVMDADEARRLAEAADTTRGSSCQNPACGDWITGHGRDRAVEGRCPTCYEYRRARRSEGRPLEDRPHRVIHRTPQPGCTDCARVHGEAVS